MDPSQLAKGEVYYDAYARVFRAYRLRNLRGEFVFSAPRHHYSLAQRIKEVHPISAQYVRQHIVAIGAIDQFEHAEICDSCKDWRVKRERHLLRPIFAN